MREYKVLFCETIEILEERVNHLLREGWHLQGGVSYRVGGGGVFSEKQEKKSEEGFLGAIIETIDESTQDNNIPVYGWVQALAK